MNVLILPGGSSPHADKYKGAYQLLCDAAKHRGYEAVRVALYPGQKDEFGNVSGKATLPSAIESVCELIKDYFCKDEFIIVARCFGCTVALSVAMKLKIDTLKKIVLWGPAPFWSIWEWYKKDFQKSYEADFKNGVDVSNDYFNSTVPIEYLLKNSYEIPVVVSAGEIDDTCPPSFFNYLREISNRNIVFKGPVKLCGHTIRPGDPGEKEYLDALFGD